MTHVTCRLTAKNRETGISSGTLRSVLEYGLPLPILPLHTLSTTNRSNGVRTNDNTDDDDCDDDVDDNSGSVCGNREARHQIQTPAERALQQ